MHIARKLATLTLAVAVLIAVGCASIIDRTAQRLTFDADVANTQVRVTESGSGIVYGPVGVPATFMLSKDSSYIVTWSTPDGKTLEVRPVRDFDPVTLINILGLLGFIGDAITGAINKYRDDGYRASFETGKVEAYIPTIRSNPKTSGSTTTPTGGNDSGNTGNTGTSGNSGASNTLPNANPAGTGSGETPAGGEKAGASGH